MYLRWNNKKGDSEKKKPKLEMNKQNLECYT